ncbi:MAG: hypothetical protein HN731_07055 [Rhodospirillaceae bacterium]|jgi:uncharacterized membrane protein|nr:hypothetical protein [Rhodospirillaceae bacterium]MBT7954931.1 hypothetical protein [Rhodospirillaceae bacterium]
MDEFAIARALHVIAVVMWIGSVSFTTFIVLPVLLRGTVTGESTDTFEQIEARVAQQAKYSTQITGLTGLYMLYVLDGWERLLDPAQWWLHAMIFIYLVFTVVIFVLEPLVLHKWFEEQASTNPQRVLGLVFKAHIVLITLSFLTIAAAVIGVHG